jgi:hypothetical protein
MTNYVGCRLDFHPVARAHHRWFAAHGAAGGSALRSIYCAALGLGTDGAELCSSTHF